MKFLSAFVCLIVMLGLFNFTTATAVAPPKQQKPDSPWWGCWRACMEKQWDCLRSFG